MEKFGGGCIRPRNSRGLRCTTYCNTHEHYLRLKHSSKFHSLNFPQIGPQIDASALAGLAGITVANSVADADG